MKRNLLILAAMLIVSMTACSQADKAKKQPATMKKTLIAYFSASGVTRSVAQRMANINGATLHEIKPEQPYTDADLDWTNDKSRSSLEMKDKTSRPAITDKIDTMADYEVVYVGFPIWWYTAPTIINTFMEAYDFSGKTVIPFATSGGSSIKKACADLKSAYPDIEWGEGRLLNNTSDKELKAWMQP